jgi:hypothetical protein
MKPRKLIIKENIRKYEKSIAALKKIKGIYNTDVNLHGNFACDTYHKINEQIKFCKGRIDGLNNELLKY